MYLRIPPLIIKIALESNLLKPAMLVGRLAVAQRPDWQAGCKVSELELYYIICCYVMLHYIILFNFIYDIILAYIIFVCITLYYIVPLPRSHRGSPAEAVAK